MSELVSPQAFADLPGLIRPAARLRPASWFLWRAVMAVLMISVFVLTSACLMYAGIEPDQTTASLADQTQSE